MPHSEVDHPPLATESSYSWWAILFLALIVAGAVSIRLDDFLNWQEHPERFFFGEDKTPLMLTVDAYYYLDLARDLMEGNYQAIDHDRYVPHGYSRPATPPLLSAGLAGIAAATGLPLEWIALFLPAFLGVLLAWPVYELGFYFGSRLNNSSTDGRLMGLVASGFAVISPFYVSRSCIGWCDTDGLNVVFSALAAYLFLRFADAEGPRARLRYLTLGGMTFLLFVSWWGQAISVVAGLTLTPLFIALLFFYKPTTRRETASIALGLAIGGILLGFWQGWDVLNPVTHLKSLLNYLGYVSKDVANSPFPVPGNFVSEQSDSSLQYIANNTAGNSVVFTVASVGLGAMVVRFRSRMLFLLPLLAVALMGVYAKRFLVFAGPLIGLGVGFAALILWQKLSQFKQSYISIPLTIAVMGMAWPAFSLIQSRDSQTPRRMPYHFDAMTRLREETPQNAVIWAAWGHGHPLTFYSRRGTIADGMHHSGKILYFLNFPLAVDDFRLAANWMQFYVAHGESGLERANILLAGGEDEWAVGIERLAEVLAVGPEQAAERSDIAPHLAFFFPESSRPVYLWLENLHVGSPWFQQGKWDLANKRGPRQIYFAYSEVNKVGDNILVGKRGRNRLHIDMPSGHFQIGRRRFGKLSHLFVRDGEKATVTDYPEVKGRRFETDLTSGHGVLMDQQSSETVLNKLFTRIDPDPKYFAPVVLDLPRYQIWHVTPDTYREQE